MQTSYLPLPAAALATLSLVVSGESFFDFYKLSLQWPPSACSVVRRNCVSPIPNFFTIHGLWLRYANDTPVKPYEKDPSCTTVTPTDQNQILVELQPIISELNVYWPNLYLNRSKPDNPSLWRHEWRSNGMCSDYPDNPSAYFFVTLFLAHLLDPLHVKEIQPGKSGYTVKHYVDAIHANWGVKPQIACYGLTQSGANIKINLLWEIRFCVERANAAEPLDLRDCPHTVDARSSCKSENDKVMFPEFPLGRLSTPEIIREIVFQM